MAKQEDNTGFLNTAYLTDAIRKPIKYGRTKCLFDPTGRTLTVWFGQRQTEYVGEETGDEIILMKGRDGRVIGFERLNHDIQPDRVTF